MGTRDRADARAGAAGSNESDAARAVTQPASQPLRPNVVVSASARDLSHEDADDAPTADALDRQPRVSAGSHPRDEDEDEAEGSTRSLGAVRSGVAMSAPRSAPSVPYVGIPRSLQKWARYEVQAVLGAGGMGAVYRARDPRLDRMVALKIIHPMLGQDDDTHGQGVVRRFLREARLQASLEHPHICKIPEGCRTSDGIA